MPTIIDDALELLNTAKIQNPNLENDSGRSVIASFFYPRGWDNEKREIAEVLIQQAVQRLAQKSHLYQDELGAASLEACESNERVCNYVAQAGEIAPSIDEIKKFIDEALRKEFANPDHWIRKKNTQGTRYFIADSDDKDDYANIIRRCAHEIGRYSPFGDSLNLKILNQNSNGEFVEMVGSSTPVILFFPPIKQDDIAKVVPIGGDKPPRQALELSESMARIIMPHLGLDMRNIKDAPRERGMG